MKIFRHVLVNVPASTSNMGPGFDVLGMAFQLFNTVEVSVAPSAKFSLRMSVDGEGKNTVPSNAQNVIWKTMKMVLNHLKFPISSYAFDIRCINRIPLARGLGSSAAASLSGILAANALCGNLLDQQEILRLAVNAEGHPDNVVPQLVGGLCVSCLDKKQIKFLKLNPRKNLSVVVCVPEFELSTKKARAALPSKVSMQDAVFNVSRVALLLASLMQGKYEFLRLGTEDRLHQNYRKKLVPGFDSVVRLGYDAGALGVMLSGAGPTMLALVKSDKAQRVSRAMERGFASAGKKSQSRILKLDRQGARVKVKGKG